MPVQRPYNPNAKRMAEMIPGGLGEGGRADQNRHLRMGREYLEAGEGGGEHQAALMGLDYGDQRSGQFLWSLFTCTSANGGSNSANGATSRLMHHRRGKIDNRS